MPSQAVAVAVLPFSLEKSFRDAAGSVLVLTLLACGAADRVTSPVPTDAPCAGAASALRPLQVAVTDCSRGTTVVLAGNRATYVVVAQLALGDVDPTPVPYTISVPGRAVYASAPVAERAPSTRATERARAFDAALRERDRALAGVAAGGLGAVAGGALRGQGATAGASASSPPAVGSTRVFHVLATADAGPQHYGAVSARLVFAGSNILLYVDAAAPAPGFTADQLEALGHRFDEVLYPMEVEAFGAPTDIDGNERLIMLLSPVVNALTPRGACASGGYIGGFVTGNDLVNADTTSNRGEVFYAIVPDPSGKVSCTHTVADVEALLGSTFLHETQHLISYSQHVIVNHGKPQAGWLDEGMSLVAEELGAVHYQATSPDSALPFLANIAAASYGYLLRPDTTSLTTRDDSDLGTQWRGGEWLLLRWLGDHAGGPAFFRALVHGRQTGVAAVEAAAGEPFPTLLGDFAMALYADSLAGIPRGALPARNTFTSRPLWSLYRATSLIGAGGRSSFPLEPRPLTGATSGTLLPGGFAFYRITGAPGVDSVTLRFGTPDGAPLPAALHPQLSILRLPDD